MSVESSVVSGEPLEMGPLPFREALLFKIYGRRRSVREVILDWITRSYTCVGCGLLTPPNEWQIAEPAKDRCVCWACGSRGIRI